MRILNKGLVASLATAALALAASAPAAGASSTHVIFSHWVYVTQASGHGPVAHVAQGTRFTSCASQKLVDLEAFYTSTGPSSGPDTEIWSLNGQRRDVFHDKTLNGGSSAGGTFFYIYPAHEPQIPSGQWTLVIKYGGQVVGRTSIKAVRRSGC